MIRFEQLSEMTPDEVRAAAAKLAKDEEGVLHLMALCIMQAQTITEQASQIDGLHAVIRNGPAIHIHYPKGWPPPPGTEVPVGSLFTPN